MALIDLAKSPGVMRKAEYEVLVTLPEVLTNFGIESPILEWDITEYLPKIDCPVLLIQGHDDEYGTFAQLDTIEATVCGPVERRELKDCRHSPHLDRRPETLQATARYINRIAVPG